MSAVRTIPEGGYTTESIPAMTSLLEGEGVAYLSHRPDVEAMLDYVRCLAANAHLHGKIGDLPVQKISQRVKQIFAYRRWEQRGRPLWQHLVDWYAAEDEIRALIRNLMALGHPPGKAVPHHTKQLLAYLRWEARGCPMDHQPQKDWHVIEAGLEAVAAMS